MTSYSERSGREPSFEVSYRFLSEDEGGRSTPPHQHTRWDFLYAGDDPVNDGVWMIWPEFLSLQNIPLPDGPVPMEGRASMFVVNLDNTAYHQERIAVGTKGYFVEGAKRVAECHVIAIQGLSK